MTVLDTRAMLAEIMRNEHAIKIRIQQVVTRLGSWHPDLDRYLINLHQNRCPVHDPSA